MILLPTLWKTVKWKPVLFYYIFITVWFWFSYDPSYGPLAIAILGQIAMTALAGITIIMVWSSVITGNKEGLPILWIFSTVVKDIEIFDEEESIQLLQMKYWCKENCNGKWQYCQHGYFVFRKKSDAMGFKLRWV